MKTILVIALLLFPIAITGLSKALQLTEVAGATKELTEGLDPTIRIVVYFTLLIFVVGMLMVGVMWRFIVRMWGNFFGNIINTQKDIIKNQLEITKLLSRISGRMDR